jgi:hypothetical protein
MDPWRRALLTLALSGLACGGSGGTTPSSLDEDGDGRTAAEDCDDHAPGRWQLLPGYLDEDRDGHGAGPLLQVCSGDALPEGYAATGDDCDDGSPGACQLVQLYVDADGDGRGAGALVPVCAGEAQLPDGYSRTTGDCAPTDRERWQELGYLQRDADGDGASVAEAGVVCSGLELPRGYSVGPGTAPDCDEADPTVWASTTAYADIDVDGVGAGPAVTLCTDGVTLPAGYSFSSTDCAPQDRAYSRMSYYGYRDVDGDGATVYAPGTVCAGDTFPAGYSNTPGPKGTDCDDGRKDVWLQLTGYADADGDGVGAAPGVALCTDGALPAGYVSTSTDCAPDDPAAWRSYAYSYRDADGDGAVVYQPGTICIGAEIPAGYSTSGAGPYDCDDSSPAVSRTVYGYVDEDGDGVGAGAAIQSCTDGSLPTGQVATGTDCAPADATRWQMLAYAGRDEDGDGWTTRAAGTLCSGAALPPTYAATASGNDCDDHDVSRWRWVVLYPDGDGDGVGAPPRTIPCLGATLPAGFSVYGWDPDDRDPRVTEAEEDGL